MPKKNEFEIAWSNYNYSFNVFHQQYKFLCLDIISKRSVYEINKSILSFISGFNYAIVTEEKRRYFIDSCYRISNNISKDQRFKEIAQLVTTYRNEQRVDHNVELEYYRKYYTYLFEILSLLGELSKELSYTFMPHTGNQTKYISYYNSEAFYNNLTDFQHEVRKIIHNFELGDFVSAFNALCVYYYAYKLFVDAKSSQTVDKLIEITINTIMSREVKEAIIKRNNPELVASVEKTVFIYINEAIRLINLSFSNYGILPRVNKKVYIDMTLI